MQGREFDIVTGAFGYTGKYITRRLLAMGRGVRTLTGHPGRHDPFNGEVEVAPLQFDRPAELAESMRGATTLYNTYWVRFARGEVTYEKAVQNTRILFQAGRAAGVGKIVHTSIANPSLGSPLGYYEGKARIEEILAGLGTSYAILRPTVIFGVEDVLINNIAWILRHLPAFAIPWPGDYPLQPVYVVDFAELAVNLGRQEGHQFWTPSALKSSPLRSWSIDCTTRGSRARLIPTPPWLALNLSRLVGKGVRDVLLTEDELKGLMAGLLVSASAPTCPTRFSEWSERHAHLLGRHYASEIDRHFRKKTESSSA